MRFASVLPRATGLTRSSGLVFAVLAGVGCGPIHYEGDPVAESGSESDEERAETETETEAGDEVNELLAELIAPRICDEVRGHFIGLPSDEARQGPAAGLDPAVGRWWIRRCEAGTQNGHLNVSIGGSGWTWLDREDSGFRVRQYLRFTANASFSASLAVGYDRESRIATIWLRPSPGVQAEVQPVGLVEAEATGVFSSVLGGLLNMTGSSASERARAQAAEEGSSQLRDRLQSGFTVTYQLDSEQMDFMIGALQRGQVPERPYPTESSRPWLVNARSTVWPGGLDVVGPIPAEAVGVSLDMELEEGRGVQVRRVCEAAMAQFIDASWNGVATSAPRGRDVITLARVRAPRSVSIPSTDCRAVLLMTPTDGSTVPLTVRYRLTLHDEGGSSVATTTSGGGSNASSVSTNPTSTAQASAIRLQVASVSVVARNPQGGNWDFIGGQADPYVVVSSIPRQSQLDRTPTLDNRHEARFGRWLPGAVRSADFPLRFVVYDEDLTGDEVIGTADVSQADVVGRSELAVELRSPGQSAARTGTLRLRLQSVQ